jgi:hypothetical protein
MTKPTTNRHPAKKPKPPRKPFGADIGGDGPALRAQLRAWEERDCPIDERRTHGTDALLWQPKND